MALRCTKQCMSYCGRCPVPSEDIPQDVANKNHAIPRRRAIPRRARCWRSAWLTPLIPLADSRRWAPTPPKRSIAQQLPQLLPDRPFRLAQKSVATVGFEVGVRVRFFSCSLVLVYSNSLGFLSIHIRAIFSSMPIEMTYILAQDEATRGRGICPFGKLWCVPCLTKYKRVEETSLAKSFLQNPSAPTFCQKTEWRNGKMMQNEYFFSKKIPEMAKWTFLPEIAGSYRGSYSSKIGLLIPKIPAAAT